MNEYWDKSGPISKDFLAAFRARDEAYARLADMDAGGRHGRLF